MFRASFSPKALVRLAAAAILATPALACAEGAPSAIVEVQGTTYAAYAKQGHAIVSATPRPARLVRDTRVAGPACDQLEEQLAGYREWIEGCKQDPSAAGACQSIRNIVETVRKEPSATLRQGWSIEAMTPAASASEAELKTKVAQAVSVPEASVLVATAASGRGAPRSAQAFVKPNGTSIASLLLGFADIDASKIRYQADVRRFVTEDHVLACGLLQGDVSLLWEQETELVAQGGATTPALAASDVYRVYQAVRDGAPIQEPRGTARAVQVGARVGAALQALSLAGGDFEAKTRLVVSVLFEGADLVLAPRLTERDIEQRIAAGSAPAASDVVQLAWKSVQAR